MENENVNNDTFPKEIKAENDNINPLLDIIANIQEKLESNNSNSNNVNDVYSNINTGYTNSQSIPNNTQANNYTSTNFFEMFNNFNSNNQKNTATNSNPFMNIDMETMMRVGKIFSSMNKEDPRKNLLLSLKPFLRNSRQKNVDTYVFILGILNVLDTFNNGDSGFSGNI